MNKGLVRWIFRSFYGLLWLIAGFLLLEFIAVGYQLYVEHTNPLVKTYKAGKPFIEKQGFVYIRDVRPEVPERLSGWDWLFNPFDNDTTWERVFEAVTARRPNFNSSQTDWDHTALFSGLSLQSKEFLARLTKELVLELDHDSKIISAYGSDKSFFQGIQKLLTLATLYRAGILTQVRSAIRQTVTLGIPNTFSIAWPNETNPSVFLPAMCIKSDDTTTQKKIFLFVKLSPDDIQPAHEIPLHKESRWLKPHFRFKANFSHEAYPGFKTNSFGFRDAERTIPKPKGIFRILCVGGSTTQEGTDNQSTYPALLEKMLRRSFPGREIEVINAGIPGISTQGHLVRIMDYLAFEPDLVILHLGVNDVLLYYNTWQTNIFPRYLRSVKFLFPHLCASPLLRFLEYHRDYMGKNLELLAYFFHRHGAATAFASIAWPDNRRLTRYERQYYNYQGKYTWDFPGFSLPYYGRLIQANNTLVKEKAARLHAIYIPIAESLQGGSELFTDFCHMTQSGIEAKAKVMFVGLFPVLAEKFSNGKSSS